MQPVEISFLNLPNLLCMLYEPSSLRTLLESPKHLFKIVRMSFFIRIIIIIINKVVLDSI